MSTEKSDFRKGLEGLTAEQFAQVEADMAAAKTARANPAEYARRLGNMSPRELEQEWSMYGR